MTHRFKISGVTVSDLTNQAVLDIVKNEKKANESKRMSAFLYVTCAL